MAKMHIIRGLKKSYSGNQGFSLIELMIVISIMAILAAVVVPNFNRIQENAKENENTFLINFLHLDISK